MALWTPPSITDFSWSATNLAARPSSTPGTDVAASNASRSAWVQLLSATAREALAIRVTAVSTTSPNSSTFTWVFDIGIDPAGGSSYTAIASDLLCSQMSKYLGSGGVTYYLPIRIPAGATVAARAQNGIGSSNVNITATVYGSPKDGRIVRAGSYVTAFGAGTVAGTAVTAGTTSEGAWTAIASSIAKPHWFWTMGFSHGGVQFSADMAAGDATNKDVIIEDFTGYSDNGATQSWWDASLPGHHGYREVPSGKNLYARVQASATPAATQQVTIYGVGG